MVYMAEGWWGVKFNDPLGCTEIKLSCGRADHRYKASLEWYYDVRTNVMQAI